MMKRLKMTEIGSQVVNLDDRIKELEQALHPFAKVAYEIWWLKRSMSKSRTTTGDEKEAARVYGIERLEEEFKK
jgi:hypothetical protein